MKSVNKLLLVFLLLCSIGFGQTVSSKLKKEEEQLEKKIATTKALLAKSKDETAASYQELTLITNQIRLREELLRNYDKQVRSAELKIKERGAQIDELNAQIVKLKEQYKKLIVYAYKHRNRYGDMMYIFSAESYYEALKRNKYLEKIAYIQQKQVVLIKQNQKLIETEIAAIQKDKAYKSTVVAQKKAERQQLDADRQKQETVYQQYKTKEQEILANLREEERKKEVLKARINEAIRKEIAEAEARRKKEEEARRLAEAKARESAKGTGPVEKPADPVVFTETKEAMALGKSFEGNRGKLPWPVEKGTITEKFGKNAHPTLDNVFTNNNGVDITSPKNAQVRSVFEGEVTSVLNIPGAGKVVIIKHGNYRTVYSNLQDVYVSKGSKVSTKQVVGSLLSKSGAAVSIAHFEIHQVVGSNVQCLNPSLWIVN